uniref:Phospho-2-dehydro-3-deoxyheptonate aldolase n=1 Tax=Haptolina brevifila TaxID=156173 RepID=A0A7S2NEL1_9EUKA
MDVTDQVAARQWKPDSWRSYEALQMATYEDQDAYSKVMNKLAVVPPLVHAAEVDQLTAFLAAAGRGQRFIIQGGDCAERFIDCTGDRLEVQLKLIVQMGAIVEKSTGVPPVRIARIAGQYGKPRSKPTETVPEYGEIYSFKGDNINGYFPADRKWDPQRLLDGYFHSAATLNFLRGLQMSESYTEQMLGGLDIDFLKTSPKFGQYSKTVQSIAEAPPSITGVFTSHEAMQLDLEEALTREVVGKGFYNLSAHMVWIGDRTRQLQGAHVEYFRGIKNPIGCKVGPTMQNDELKQLVKILNPDKVEGRLVLITRYGADKVGSMLPGHIKAVQEAGVPVVWQCDGVHGNTVTASNKLKTRKFDDIMSECTQAMQIHKENSSVLAGVHLEMTGQSTVTECTGGSVGLFEEMLTQNYETYCDPRLNYGQAIESAFVLAGSLRP